MHGGTLWLQVGQWTDQNTVYIYSILTWSCFLQLPDIFVDLRLGLCGSGRFFMSRPKISLREKMAVAP
jgi:hypothetical protein